MRSTEDSRSTLDMPLPALSAGLRTGRIDVHAYLDALCDRIDDRDVELFALLPEPARRARLHREADAIERRWPRPASRPALYGVPVAIKDVLHVDGFPTQAGSALPPSRLAGPEGGAVGGLRAAGALILGKAVTAEFAYFEPGPTRNPRAPGRTPGGSSSGSAAAVAAGLAPLALGTQTFGSVIRPAAFCGVAGFKPSRGRVPGGGLVYYSPSVDTIGWFAADAGGLVEAARVLVDGWRESRYVTPTPPRLAVPEGPYLAQAEPAALEAFYRTLEALARAGIELRRLPALDDIEAIALRHRWLTSAEFADVHEEWFGEFASRYRPRTAALVEEGHRVTEEQRRAGLESGPALRARLHALLETGEYAADAWVSPSATGPAPRGLGSTGSPAMNTPWTHAGLPVATVPAGELDGLPLGLQLAGRFNEDEALLGCAAAIEAALRAV